MDSLHGFACFLTVLTVVAGSSPIEMIELCRANDPNLNQCVKDRANDLIPKIAEGIPDYGIPTLDPLFTPFMELVEETKYASIDMKYMNLTQRGLSKMVVDDAKIDLAKGEWALEFYQPVFSLSGNYESKGTVMEMQIDGSGQFNSTHYDTKSTVTIGTTRVTRNDREYFQLDRFRICYTFGSARMHYSNLFNGDADLEKSTNDFLNEHSHEILNDLKPALEEVYEKLFREYVAHILDHVPCDQLFVQE